MIQVDTIEDILAKINSSASSRLYLGCGNGEEVFSDMEKDPSKAYVGVELEGKKFIDSMLTYGNLPETQKKKVSFLRYDATSLPDRLKEKFDEVIINYPWNTIDSQEIETGLYSFLSEDKYAGPYLSSLLKDTGEIRIRVHPETPKRIEAIEKNLKNYFRIEKKDLPDHVESSFGYKYSENQKQPTKELVLYPI